MSKGGAQISSEEVGRRLVAKSPVLQWLGAEIVVMQPGHCHLAMMVRTDHTNVIGITHGGIVFTLADAALGFAQSCRNERVVSADAEIRFLAPAKEGQRLEAEAKEIWRRAPHALMDVEVRQAGHVIAVVRGRTRALGEPHFVA